MTFKTFKRAIVIVILFASPEAKAQQNNQDIEPRNAYQMPAGKQWFQNARLGIFIHWGIYGVNGIDESWSFYNQYLPYKEYMKQLDGFTAKNYHPEEWASLIKGSGARYTVITTKHHDGVALWDTRANDLSVVKKTPAKKDLLTPFVNEVRKQGLKLGLYYSLMDWSHPDFPVKNRQDSRLREKWAYTPQANPQRWSRFMDFNFVQYKELINQYNPDMWFFDGHWWFSADEWRAKATADLIHAKNPNAVINDRLPDYGDYLTPEQGVPLTQPTRPWEACMTMNGAWGYQPSDKNYKSIFEIISLLADCAHLGGNLLLDIGPKPDGTIPEEQVKILKGLGRWTSKHEKAIFDNQPGLDLAYYNGPSTIGKSSYLGKESLGDILYLFVPGKPNGSVRLKGLQNKIARCWVVGNGAKINYRQDPDLAHPGIVYFNVPEQALDEDMTVIGILLDGTIKLQPLNTNEKPKPNTGAATTG